MLLRRKRVLVTGANGFIGGYLLEALQCTGAVVSALEMVPAPAASAVPQYTGDLRDAAFVRACIADALPEVVFHLAAFKERTSELAGFAEAISINVLGSLNLVSALWEQKRDCRLVVVGTAEEYGHNAAPFSEEMREAPVSAYSFSKMCVTQLCRLLYTVHHLPFVALRPTIAYGPRQNVDMFLPALINSLLAGKPFPMTAGQQTRDFVYVTDVVDALLGAAVSESAVGHVINIGSGEPIQIGELALKIERILGKSGLVRLGAAPYRPSEIMEYSVATRKAAELLGWRPRVKLDNGLARTVAYYQDAVIA